MHVSQPAKPESFEFAGFVLDANARELRHAGQSVELEPKAFDLLLLLIRRPDHTFTKDEINSAVWPGRVISDSVIAQAVSKIRQATGDTARDQAVIKTLHGVGYRFAATARPYAAPGSPVPWATRRWLWVAAGLALLLLLLQLPTSPRDSNVTPTLNTIILPFANATGDSRLDWVEAGLPGLLAAGMEGQPGFGLVPLETVRAVAAALSAASGPVPEVDRIAELRRVLGGDLVITGEVRGEPKAWQLVMRIHDARGQARESTIAATRLSELVTAGAFHQMLATAPQPSAPERQAFSDDDYVNMTYARALSARDQGNAGEARDLLALVLRFEPEQQAVRLLLARTEMDLGNPAAGEKLLDEVEAALAAAGTPDPGMAIRLFNLRGAWAAGRGEIATAGDFHQRALDAATASGNRLQQAEGFRYMGLVASRQGRFEDAEDLLGQSLTLFSSLNYLPGQADCYNALGVLAWRRGLLAESERWDRLALAAYRQIGRRDGVAATLSNQAVVAAARGDLTAANRLLEEALAIHRELGNAQGIASALGNLSVNYTLTNRLSEAREATDELIAHAERMQAPRFAAFGHMSSGGLDSALGRHEAAAASFADAADRFGIIGDNEFEAQARGRHLRALLALQRTEEAETLLAMHSATLSAAASPAARALIAALEADFALAAGDPERAVEHLRGARLLALEGEGITHANVYTSQLAEVLLRMGRTEDAAVWIGRLDDADGHLSHVDRVRARYAYEQGRYEEAMALMQRARERAREGWNADHEAALARFDQALTSGRRVALGDEL